MLSANVWARLYSEDKCMQKEIGLGKTPTGFPPKRLIPLTTTTDRAQTRINHSYLCSSYLNWVTEVFAISDIFACMWSRFASENHMTATICLTKFCCKKRFGMAFRRSRSSENSGEMKLLQMNECMSLKFLFFQNKQQQIQGSIAQTEVR